MILQERTRLEAEGISFFKGSEKLTKGHQKVEMLSIRHEMVVDNYPNSPELVASKFLHT